MRAKMDRTERAKQFMPFAALDGLTQTLARLNPEQDARICLGEDAQIELDRRLHALYEGGEVCAVFYRSGQYRTLTGTLEKIDLNARALFVAGTRIPIDELLDVHAAI